LRRRQYRPGPYSHEPDLLQRFQGYLQPFANSFFAAARRIRPAHRCGFPLDDERGWKKSVARQPTEEAEQAERT